MFLFNVFVKQFNNNRLVLFDLQSNIILALGSNGASAALIHPSGSVYQYGSRVEITTPDPIGNTK